MVLLYTAVEEGYAPWLFRAQTNSLEALFVCHDCSYKILLSLALNYCLTPGNTVMYNSFNEINNFAIRLFILLQTPEKNEATNLLLSFDKVSFYNDLLSFHCLWSPETN